MVMMEKTLYDAYINSDAWRSSPARLEALRRDGYRCRGCNATDDLEVHHRTYEHFGHEHPEDLTVLCRECHEAITTVIRRRRYANRTMTLVQLGGNNAPVRY
jgi:5-methylcytosine-specific restriction endonuclease McrA